MGNIFKKLISLIDWTVLTHEGYMQAKWEYFSKLSKYLIIFSSIASICYLFSDALLFDAFPWETLIPRCIIIFPLAYYLYKIDTCTDYKTMSFLTLLMCHIIHWCTTWATLLLPDQSHVGEGIIIMHIIFFGATYGAPFIMATLMHWTILLNIILPNCFMHWLPIEDTLAINIPILLAITCFSYVLDKVYKDHYLLRDELETAMVTDALTQTYNRHKLDSISERGIIQVSERVKMPITLILLDIDFFKRVNDTYGHDDGDKILCAVAQALKTCVREKDLVVRWGGEEFVILLMNCNQYEGVQTAERIRGYVEKIETGICDVTISLGVAPYIVDHEYGDIVDTADSALYEAKRTGRNRTVTLYKDKFMSAEAFLNNDVYKASYAKMEEGNIPVVVPEHKSNMPKDDVLANPHEAKLPQ